MGKIVYFFWQILYFIGLDRDVLLKVQTWVGPLDREGPRYSARDWYGSNVNKPEENYVF